jgi:hypothetical protein
MVVQTLRVYLLQQMMKGFYGGSIQMVIMIGGTMNYESGLGGETPGYW